MSGTEVATWVVQLLIQHLWQGLLLAGALALTLLLAKRSTATTRHAFCSIAMLALLALPLAAWSPLPDWTASAFTTSHTSTVRSAANTGRAEVAPDAGSTTPVRPVDRSSIAPPSFVVRALDDLAPIGAWIVFAVWIAGAGWMLIRLTSQVIRGERLRRDAVVWRGDRLPGLLGTTDLRQSGAVTSPVVVGLVRPSIVLPAGFERRCSTADLMCVLAHEQAHVQRRDGRWHLLQRVAEALFFFHPGVRWVARRMEFEREAACDDWAAAHTGGLALYSASLLTVCESVQRAPRPALAVGALSSRSQLARRVENMLDNARDHRPRGSMGLAAAFAATLIVLVAALAVAFPAPTLAAADDNRRATARYGEQRGATPLIRAAQDGDAAEVLRLLDAGADPNESADREPRSPLYAAAVAGDIGTLSVLLDRGAKVDRVVPGDATPLMAASRHGNLMAARLLVSRGADVNIRLSGDGTQLINAAAGGNAEIVALLIDQGADVNAAVSGDGTPLIVASRHGHRDIVRLLIEAGAGPENAVSGDGSPLINAARSGRLATVQALVSAGADVDKPVFGDGSPLIAAASSGHVEITRFLIANGADVDAIVPGDETPLINAAGNGHVEVAQLLLDAGADPNLGVYVDSWTSGRSRTVLRSPMTQARSSGNDDMVRLLIRHGATD